MKPNVWNLNRLCLSPEISCDFIYGVVTLVVSKFMFWSFNERNSTLEPLSTKYPKFTPSCSLFEVIVHILFLLPKGESPNTSDMSLPDDGTTDT